MPQCALYDRINLQLWPSFKVRSLLPGKCHMCRQPLLPHRLSFTCFSSVLLCVSGNAAWERRAQHVKVGLGIVKDRMCAKDSQEHCMDNMDLHAIELTHAVCCWAAAGV